MVAVAAKFDRNEILVLHGAPRCRGVYGVDGNSRNHRFLVRAYEFHRRSVVAV